VLIRRTEAVYLLRKHLGYVRIILNRRRSHIYIDLPTKKIVISERYQRKIKIISRLVLLASIITSILALPPPYSFLVSLGTIVIEQLLERIDYSFLSVLIVPFPSFNLWRKANFNAMIFARSDAAGLPRVGMAFSDPGAAKRVWRYIEDWNYGSAEDLDNNVCVSIVINKKAGAYALFVYPNPARPTTKAAKAQLQNGKGSKRQQMHIGQMIICKIFPLNGSGLEKVFLPKYVPGENYLFECWIMGKPARGLKGTLQIRKRNLKLIGHDQLTPNDLEYHMTKYDIQWDSLDPGTGSIFYSGNPDKRA